MVILTISCHGDITATVVGDYEKVSLYCRIHGYMGGENLLIYNNDFQIGILNSVEIFES